VGYQLIDSQCRHRKQGVGIVKFHCFLILLALMSGIMLWMNSKRTRWQSAFSKSMLMMFIAQLLLSAACISTANADSMSRNVSATAHCHNERVVSSHVSDAGHTTNHNMSACSHCDTPDMGVSASVAPTADMVPVLLAVIELPEMSVLSTSDTSSLVDDNALSHSFSLLYQTTQRILI